MENETNMQNPQGAAVRSETGMGATIGIVIIILILATGGIYLWMSKHAPAPVSQEGQATQTEESDARTTALMQTSSSDTASAIEADLSATTVGDSSSDLQVQ